MAGGRCREPSHHQVWDVAPLRLLPYKGRGRTWVFRWARWAATVGNGWMNFDGGPAGLLSFFSYCSFHHRTRKQKKRGKKNREGKGERNKGVKEKGRRRFLSKYF